MGNISFGQIIIIILISILIFGDISKIKKKISTLIEKKNTFKKK